MNVSTIAVYTLHSIYILCPNYKWCCSFSKREIMESFEFHSVHNRFFLSLTLLFFRFFIFFSSCCRCLDMATFALFLIGSKKKLILSHDNDDRHRLFFDFPALIWILHKRTVRLELYNNLFLFHWFKRLW